MRAPRTAISGWLVAWARVGAEPGGRVAGRQDAELVVPGDAFLGDPLAVGPLEQDEDVGVWYAEPSVDVADGDGGIASASSAAVQKATPWSRSGFGYRIADIRRLGDPVDHIIFDGLDEVRAGSRESLREIVLLDVKTAGARLSQIQRRIQAGVNAGRVSSHHKPSGG